MLTRRKILRSAAALGLSSALTPLLRAADAPPTDLASPNSRFKIGVCDWMISGKGGTPAALTWAGDLGLDGVMASFGSPDDKFDLRKSENRQLFAEASKKSGATIASLGMGILNNIPYKSDPRTEQWVADAIDVARAVGTNIVLIAFFAKGDLKNDKPGTDEVIRRFKRVAPRAEKAGVTLGIESWLSAQEHMHIIDSVGSPAIKVYYDVGNSFKMGYDIYKEIRWLKLANICEFHAKDYANKLFGQGEIDFHEVRRCIDEIGYKGWIHLEGPMPFGLDRSYAHDRHYLKAVFPPNG
jgi:sugar phosphate isomerase/epimerase